MDAALFTIKCIIKLTSEMHGSEEVRRIGAKTEQLSSILQILKSTATKYVFPEHQLLLWLQNLRFCNETLSKLQNMVWHYARGGNMAKKFTRSFMYATLDKKELEKLFNEFAKSLEYFDKLSSLMIPNAVSRQSAFRTAWKTLFHNIDGRLLGVKGN